MRAPVERTLGAFSAEELEVYATAGVMSGELATALGVVGAGVGGPGAERGREVGGSGLGLSGMVGSEAGVTSQAWEKVELLPGLELMVKAGASPLVRRLVREIHEHCVGAR